MRGGSAGKVFCYNGKDLVEADLLSSKVYTNQDFVCGKPMS